MTSIPRYSALTFCLLVAGCLGAAPDGASVAPDALPPDVASPAKTCTRDNDCSGGQAGSGLVCSTEGDSAGHCIPGCHHDSDCPSAQLCDGTGPHWACVVPLGGACTSDAQCNGGRPMDRVCSVGGHVCIAGCHQDGDCFTGEVCRHDTATWTCGAPSTTPTPPSGVAGYDAAAAVSYADAHWDDGNGECAQFVSDSAIVAGHLGLGYTDWVPTLYQELSDAGVGYDEYTPSHTAVRACPGDIVIYSNAAGSDFCLPGATDVPEQNCGHTGLVVAGGDGIDAILADFHNNAHSHFAISGVLTGEQLGAYSPAYSTLRLYHVASCP